MVVDLDAFYNVMYFSRTALGAMFFPALLGKPFEGLSAPWTSQRKSVNALVSFRLGELNAWKTTHDVIKRLELRQFKLNSL